MAYLHLYDSIHKNLVITRIKKEDAVFTTVQLSTSACGHSFAVSSSADQVSALKISSGSCSAADCNGRLDVTVG